MYYSYIIPYVNDFVLSILISLIYVALTISLKSWNISVYLTAEILLPCWLNDKAIPPFWAMSQCGSQETDPLKVDCQFYP